MAVLSNADRAAVHVAWMRETSRQRAQLPGLTKADLRAAVDAIDSWVDTNAAAFNLAIPLPAGNQLTAKQKAWLLFFVADKRFEVA